MRQIIKENQEQNGIETVRLLLKEIKKTKDKRVNIAYLTAKHQKNVWDH